MRAAVSADDVRPLTDTVTVQAPEIVPYEVQITWYLSRSQEPLLSTIQAKVLAAVEQYRLWQRAKPGRDILPLKLSSLIEQAGARRIDMPAPVYRALAPYQLARETAVSVAYGGVEDD